MSLFHVVYRYYRRCIADIIHITQVTLKMLNKLLLVYDRGLLFLPFDKYLFCDQFDLCVSAGADIWSNFVAKVPSYLRTEFAKL